MNSSNSLENISFHQTQYFASGVFLFQIFGHEEHEYSLENLSFNRTQYCFHV